MDDPDLNTGRVSVELLPSTPKGVHENKLLTNLNSDELGIGGDLSLVAFSHFVKDGEESHVRFGKDFSIHFAPGFISMHQRKARPGKIAIAGNTKFKSSLSISCSCH